MPVTAEIRWFWPEAPAALGAWFRDGQAHGGLAAWGPETRVDDYLRDSAQPELGLKVRGGGPGVEVKGRVEAARAQLSAGPFRGPIEVWAKWTSWSLALPAGGTLPVAKARWLRKIGVDGGRPLELALGPAGRPRQGPALAAGCLAELTELRLPGGERWWTFALEAFGPPATLVATLEGGARLLALREPPGLGAARLASYPAWLAGRPG